MASTDNFGTAPSRDDARGMSWKQRCIHTDRLRLSVILNSRVELKQRDVITRLVL